MRIQRQAVCALRFRFYDPRSMLCVYGGSSTACQGDSGGPLIVTDPRGRRYVVGVVSGGDATCDLRVPAVYSNVARGPLADFVARHAARLERQAAAEPAPPPPEPPAR